MTRTPTPPAPTNDASRQRAAQVPDERAELVRQWKYRWAQSVVFGVPVLVIHRIGPKLGGPEAARWVGLFEALLAGWVVYIAAAGMIGDAIVRRQWTVHLVVATAAIAAYGIGFLGFVASLSQMKTPDLSRGFLISTAILVLWCFAAWLFITRSDHRHADAPHSE